MTQAMQHAATTARAEWRRTWSLARKARRKGLATTGPALACLCARERREALDHGSPFRLPDHRPAPLSP